MQSNSIVKEFIEMAQGEPFDPSVAYAEAVLNGETSVTVRTLDGQSYTYAIGREFNCGE